MAAVIWRHNRVYINDADYLGKIAEGTVELKRAFTELNGLGMPAPIKAPNGRFEEITASLKFDSIAPADIRRVIGEDGFINLRLMGKCFLPDVSAGKVAHDEMRSRLTGWIEEIPIPPTNTDHKSETEITVHVALIEVSDASGTLLLIDTVNGVVEPLSLG